MSTIHDFNTHSHFSLFELSPDTIFKSGKAQKSAPSSPSKIHKPILRPIENTLSSHAKINIYSKSEKALFTSSVRISAKRETPDGAAGDEGIAAAIAKETDAPGGRLYAGRKLTEEVNKAFEKPQFFDPCKSEIKKNSTHLNVKKASSTSTPVMSVEQWLRNAQINIVPSSFTLESSSKTTPVSCVIPKAALYQLIDATYRVNFSRRPSSVSTLYQLVEASMDGIKFKDGDFARAIKDGCFKVRIPTDFDALVGRNFAKWIEQNPGEQKGEWNKRRNLQKAEWVNKLAKFESILKDIGLKTIERCLIELNIPKQYWHQATSGAVYDFGQNVFKVTCNRFQKNREDAYYDMGYVTVSDCIPAGFEIKTTIGFRPVEATDKFCLISFGKSMEALTFMSPQPITTSIYKDKLNDSSYNSTKLYLLPPEQGEMWTHTGDNLEHFGSRESLLAASMA